MTIRHLCKLFLMKLSKAVKLITLVRVNIDLFRKDMIDFTLMTTKHKEFPLITKKGAHIEVLLNATTRRDEQGNIIGKQRSSVALVTHSLPKYTLHSSLFLIRCGGYWARYYCSLGTRARVLKAYRFSERPYLRKHTLA